MKNPLIVSLIKRFATVIMVTTILTTMQAVWLPVCFAESSPVVNWVKANFSTKEVEIEQKIALTPRERFEKGKAEMQAQSEKSRAEMQAQSEKTRAEMDSTFEKGLNKIITLMIVTMITVIVIIIGAIIFFKHKKRNSIQQYPEERKYAVVDAGGKGEENSASNVNSVITKEPSIQQFPEERETAAINEEIKGAEYPASNMNSSTQQKSPTSLLNILNNNRRVAVALLCAVIWLCWYYNSNQVFRYRMFVTGMRLDKVDGIYSGEVTWGKPNGLGKFIVASDWEQSTNGPDTIERKHIISLTGEFKDGKFEGKGTRETTTFTRKIHINNEYKRMKSIVVDGKRLEIPITDEEIRASRKKGTPIDGEILRLYIADEEIRTSREKGTWVDGKLNGKGETFSTYITRDKCNNIDLSKCEMRTNQGYRFDGYFKDGKESEGTLIWTFGDGGAITFEGEFSGPVMLKKGRETEWKNGKVVSRKNINE